MTGSIRDLLLKHPYGGPDFGGCECGQIIGGAQDVWADHLAPIIADATTPRTITAVEELDALPDGSIIRSGDGLPFQKDDGAWVQLTGDDISMSMLIPGSTLIHHAGPSTVLHEGARDE